MQQKSLEEIYFRKFLMSRNNFKSLYPVSDKLMNGLSIIHEFIMIKLIMTYTKQ